MTLTGGEVARADQPVRPGVRGARRRPGDGGRAAGAEPARGAVHPRRQPDPGLPAYVAAPARLASTTTRTSSTTPRSPRWSSTRCSPSARSGCSTSAPASSRCSRSARCPTSWPTSARTWSRPRPASSRSRSRRSLLPPDHITSITYTGGTTGKPKGVIGLSQSFSTMTQIQLAEWEWPEDPRFLMCTPLSHAGAAFFTPTVIKGGSLYVLPRFDPAEVLADDRGAEDHRHDAGALDALRADGPPGLAHPRPVVAGDRLLRRVARSTRSGSRRRSTGSGRSSRSTTGSPRRRW